MPAVQRVIAYSESARREISMNSGFRMMRSQLSCLQPNMEASREIAWSDRRFAYRSGLSSASPAIIPIRLAESARCVFSAEDSLEARRAPWPGTCRILIRSSAPGLYPELELEAGPKGVIFLGPVPQGQLQILYKQAEALVFASLYEGFGLPPLEAMAMGTPVIAMPVSAMPEVCGDGVLYALGLSAEALSRAMERVACDPGLQTFLRTRI